MWSTLLLFFFFSSRRRHTRFKCDWSSDVCSSDLSGSCRCRWSSLSSSTYNGMILSGTTGAKQLTLPFVQPGVGPIEIIRRPLAGESVTSTLGVSRLYNQTQIRVLLSDNPAALPGGTGHAQNILLAHVNTSAAAPDYTNGVPVAGASNTFFAEGVRKTVTDTKRVFTTLPGPGGESNWSSNPSVPPPAEATLVPVNAPLLTPTSTTDATGNITTTQPWDLLDGYLRVEIRRADGSYAAVTKEWLR